MKINIHPMERGLRVVFGLFIMSLSSWGPNNAWFLLGIIPVTTGIIGWCPFYSMIGISTCPTKPDGA